MIEKPNPESQIPNLRLRLAVVCLNPKVREVREVRVYILYIRVRAYALRRVNKKEYIHRQKPNFPNFWIQTVEKKPSPGLAFLAILARKPSPEVRFLGGAPCL